MTKRKLRFARCGGLCGSAYLVSLFFTIPDFLRCFTCGVAATLLILAFLPEETLEKLEKRKPWKHHGE